MKSFQSLIDETTDLDDLEELESAADLFQFGIEKGFYTKRQSDEFNSVYWKVKNKCLTNKISNNVKGNKLDLIYIVTNAPLDVKSDTSLLTNYVNERIKALKGKIKGLH